MGEVLYEVRDRVGYITLNRPEQRNAINKDMAEGIFKALDDVKNNPDVWVCLITGNGRDFSTGHDLTWANPEIGSGRSTEDLYEYLVTIWKPTVAAINGYCLAQGAGIACSCDIRIASEDAKLGWPQSKRGFPSTSGPSILARIHPVQPGHAIPLYWGFYRCTRSLALAFGQHDCTCLKTPGGGR